MKKVITLIIALAMVLTMSAPAFADTTADESTPAQLTSAQVKAITPTSVKAASYSYTKIKVSWDKIEGVDGYKVYRSTSKNGRYSPVYTTTNPDKLYYINTGRTTGRNYYYKVRAYKVINGKTVYTSYSGITYAYARPGKVKISKVTCPEDLCVRIYWNKVSGADGYEIYRSKKGASNWKKCDYTHDKFSWTYSKKNLYATNMLSTIQGDAYIDWQYKVRAYKIVNGKKVYGLFSSPAEWIPDWTIDEIYEELWKYGESLEWPYCDRKGSEWIPVKDGKTYQFKHFTAYYTLDEGVNWHCLYTNPDNGITTVPADAEIENRLPDNSSWSACWPQSIFKYMTQKSILHEMKDQIKLDLTELAAKCPMYWDEDFGMWDGMDQFTIYIKPYKNGYNLWLLG